MDLIETLISEGWLKTPTIIEAFRAIKRKDFLPPEIKHLAERNLALPIGWGQTISQPLVVAFMLELLAPEAGERVLDIGSGSGWTTALLARLISQGDERRRGEVIAIDIVPGLKEFGEKNVSRYNFVKRRIVHFVCADGSKGYPKEAPFDKILASATIEEADGKSVIPKAWRKQLKVGGKIVAPVNTSLWLFHKKKKDEFEEKEYPGFVFVPLVRKK